MSTTEFQTKKKVFKMEMTKEKILALKGISDEQRALLLSKLTAVKSGKTVNK